MRAYNQRGCRRSAQKMNPGTGFGNLVLEKLDLVTANLKRLIKLFLANFSGSGLVSAQMFDLFLNPDQIC